MVFDGDGLLGYPIVPVLEVVQRDLGVACSDGGMDSSGSGGFTVSPTLQLGLFSQRVVDGQRAVF